MESVKNVDQNGRIVINLENKDLVITLKGKELVVLEKALNTLTVGEAFELVTKIKTQLTEQIAELQAAKELE